MTTSVFHKWICVGLLFLLASGPVGAVTKSRKVSTPETKVFALATGNSGQILLTLHWKTRSARLALLLVCDDLPVGVSASDEDRFQRLEVGIPASSVCEIGVKALRGRSKFWLNIQLTGGSGGALSQKGRTVVSMKNESFPALVELSEKLERQYPPKP